MSTAKQPQDSPPALSVQDLAEKDSEIAQLNPEKDTADKFCKTKTYEQQSHRPAENWMGDAYFCVPDGTALAEKIIAYAPYFDFVLDAHGEMTDITPTEKPPIPVEESKAQKLSEISATCQAAIHAGFDLETENGTEHFSLTAEDQINIQNLMMQVASGALAVPYHADNTPCRMFSAGEIMAVAEGAVRHKTYHTTYCNHLNVWIRRCTDAQELQDITYGTELPEDLAANMAALLGGADA